MNDLFSSSNHAEKVLEKTKLLEAMKMESYDGMAMDTGKVQRIMVVAPEIVRTYAPEHNFLLSTEEENAAIVLEAVSASHIKMGIGVAVMMLIYKIFKVLFNNSAFEIGGGGGGGGGRGTVSDLNNDVDTVSQKQKEVADKAKELSNVVNSASVAHAINDDGSKENNRLNNLANKLQRGNANPKRPDSAKEAAKIISQSLDEVNVSGLPKCITELEGEEWNKFVKYHEVVIDIFKYISRWGGNILDVKQDRDDLMNSVLGYFSNRDSGAINNLTTTNTDKLLFGIFDILKNNGMITKSPPNTGDIKSPMYVATLTAPIGSTLKTIFDFVLENYKPSNVQTLSMGSLEKLKDKTKIIGEYNEVFKEFAQENQKLAEQTSLEFTKKIQDEQLEINKFLDSLKVDSPDIKEHEKGVAEFINNRITFFKEADSVIFNILITNASKMRKDNDSISKSLKNHIADLDSISAELDKCKNDAIGEVV